MFQISLQALFKGWMGESDTAISQWLFLNHRAYHCFNNVLVNARSRETQIDHVIVSKFGVFVTETKNRSGWIYGSGSNPNWTQVLYKKKIRFQNPLRQNYLHTKSLAEFLEIDHRKIHSIVVFRSGTFKTKMPENVLTSSEYTRYIKNKNQILFTDDEVDRICSRLRARKDETPFLSGLDMQSCFKTDIVVPVYVLSVKENSSNAYLKRVKKHIQSSWVARIIHDVSIQEN